MGGQQGEAPTGWRQRALVGRQGERPWDGSPVLEGGTAPRPLPASPHQNPNSHKQLCSVYSEAGKQARPTPTAQTVLVLTWELFVYGLTPHPTTGTAPGQGRLLTPLEGGGGCWHRAGSPHLLLS